MKRLFRSDNGARLALLRRPESAPINGIEAIEVLTANQRTLRVTFVRNIAATLTPAHCAISGGVRITGVRILPEGFARSGRNLTFKVDRAGDFSWYEFALQDPAAPEDARSPMRYWYSPMRSCVTPVSGVSSARALRLERAWS